MTNANNHTVTADRAVAAALAGSAAASAAVPEADLEPLPSGRADDPARSGALYGDALPGAGPAGAVSAGGGRGEAAPADAMLAWRWIVGTDALDLHAAHVSSPHWRATCVGAGGALHRARVALAAEGLAARVTLLPDTPARWETGPPETPHLARVAVAGTIEVTDEARALYAATDPDDGDDGDQIGLALRSRAPARALARELVGAARAEGVRLRLIRDGAELVGLLHGPDSREGWLRAGMAASAVRLLGRRHGLATATALATYQRGPATTRRRATLPGTPPTRTGWRRIGDREGWLSVGIGTPYLRLRLAPVSGETVT